jgi:hypothetical protein
MLAHPCARSLEERREAHPRPPAASETEEVRTMVFTQPEVTKVSIRRAVVKP